MSIIVHALQCNHRRWAGANGAGDKWDVLKKYRQRPTRSLPAGSNRRKGTLKTITALLVVLSLLGLQSVAMATTQEAECMALVQNCLPLFKDKGGEAALAVINTPRGPRSAAGSQTVKCRHKPCASFLGTR
jgi:hypothetical protein